MEVTVAGAEGDNHGKSLYTARCHNHFCSVAAFLKSERVPLTTSQDYLPLMVNVRLHYLLLVLCLHLLVDHKLVGAIAPT